MLPTPDGAWHRDSHYWRKFIGVVHNIQIFIRDLLKEILRKSSAKDENRKGPGWSPLPMGNFIGAGYITYRF